VKYADLSNDRARDYRFDWDRMLSFDGNTAPYIQYANARVCSILRRAASAGGEEPAGEEAAGEEAAGEEPGGPSAAELRERFLRPQLLLAPSEAEERELAKRLLGFPDAVAASIETYSPHKLCAYLFDLATTFTNFYERCPVLRAPSEETRSSRLALSALAGAILETGLSLLGIAAPERM
jgi:arginyl-tRNA synthetase